MVYRNRKKVQAKRSQAEAAEINDLTQLIHEGAPPASGEQAAGSTESYANARKFTELPISQYSKDGLREAKYISLTAIQRYALPHALCGRDVLGAAKTGSGKTLAFLIPVLEKLFRARWGPLDGLGALVISPTRELALQIFNELRKIGKRHEFSAGLLIGGKDIKDEQGRVRGMNILICTPGRLLQHMDETPDFDASNLQILVLDEADRILDMGFSAAVNAIVENLPTERQTLLFSATQTKSVRQLARLSLDAPEYVSVHENAEAPTPVKLEQAYAVCELQDKLSILWSFIRTHLKSKILVFASTCKQVKFIFEAFSRLRPGCPLRCLHGGMKQMKRMAVFYDFCETTSGMVLLATDIAARGLDFAKLDWVVQLDCPEDVASYIHRVGRTARYVSAGRGMLLLLQSEIKFLEQLEAAKVPIKSIRINPTKTQPLQPALQALLSKHQDLKESAQRSITAYFRSVFLAPNKAVFDVTKLPAEEFALSLGLSAPPKLRFVKKTGRKSELTDIPGPAQEATYTASLPAGDGRPDALEEAGSPDECEQEDALLVLKSQGTLEGDVTDTQSPVAADLPVTGKKRKKKMRIKPEAVANNRIVFDDEGAALDPLAALAEDPYVGERDEEGVGHATAAERFKAAAAALRARDVVDKQDYQQRRKSKLAELKAKTKARDTAEAVGLPTLGTSLRYSRKGGAQTGTDSEETGTSGRDSDVDDSRGPLQLKRKKHTGGFAAQRPAVEKAHLGMAKKQTVELANLSVAQQEALALNILSRRQ